MRPYEQGGFSWISLPAAKDNLGSFQNFILGLMEKHQVPHRISLKIEMVLEEILLNIINYAYPQDSPGIIEAGCLFSEEGKLVIRIIDRGSPFDPSSSPDPDTTLSLEDRNMGGLGVFLARRLSDEIGYRRKDGQNILDISFRL